MLITSANYPTNYSLLLSLSLSLSLSLAKRTLVFAVIGCGDNGCAARGVGGAHARIRVVICTVGHRRLISDNEDGGRSRDFPRRFHRTNRTNALRLIARSFLRRTCNSAESFLCFVSSKQKKEQKKKRKKERKRKGRTIRTRRCAWLSRYIETCRHRHSFSRRFYAYGLAHIYIYTCTSFPLKLAEC